MEKMGIISYDREKDLVKLLPAAQDFDLYLETVKKGDIPWSLHYMALSALAMLGIAVIEAGIVNFVSVAQWALFISGLVFISSLAHTKHMKKI